MKRLLCTLAVTALLTGGCDVAPQSDNDPADREDAAFIGGKADGGCVSPGSPAASGMLELVNDVAVTLDDLDRSTSKGGVGLDRRAAAGIIDARPIANLESLDDVPYVGQAACRALADYACNVGSRCMQELSVMSWNLRNFPYTEQTAAAAIELITEQQPDLVGLQEIKDIDAFERLLEGLPDYTGVLAEPGPFTRVAILVRSTQLDLARIDHLFVEDWYAFPRPFLAVNAEVLGAREPVSVTFGVVHLKAIPGAANEKRRRSATSKLRTWVDGLRAAGATDVIVVGDFNDELSDPPNHNVFEALTEEDAEIDFLTQAIDAAGGFTYVPSPQMLDHVFVTREAELRPTVTEVLELERTWRDDYLDVVSDHRPVVSHFEVAVGY